MSLLTQIYIFSTIIHLALSAGILYNLKRIGEFDKDDVGLFLGLAICPIVNTAMISLAFICCGIRLWNINKES